MKKDYAIGIDIGTSSVGYAMTDMEGQLLKRKGRSTFGVLLFETANTAADRRKSRSTRRRHDRRNQRIDLLQALMEDDVLKATPNFFHMLNESFLQGDDRRFPSLYGSLPPYLFTDGTVRVTPQKDTHECDAPTIYHIRKWLSTTDKQADIRYVYLAIHHIMKYRGHFLMEGEKLGDSDTDIGVTVKNLLDNLADIEQQALLISHNDETVSAIVDALGDTSMRRKDKLDAIVKLLKPQGAPSKKAVTNLAKLVLGQSASLAAVLDDDSAPDKVSFASEDFEEDNLCDALGEDGELVRQMIDIYRWQMFAALRKGGKTVSQIMVDRYEKHRSDLQKLKEWIRKYAPEQYDLMFRTLVDKKGNVLSNYANYTNSFDPKNFEKGSEEEKDANEKAVKSGHKRCTQDALYTYVKKILSFGKTDEAQADAKPMITDMEEENGFLPLQRIRFNGAIPNQMHEEELRLIIERQSRFYPTMRENGEKICAICTFRLPYYVGPLNTQSPFSWVVRKPGVPITPWTFDKVVDKAATADQFIVRLTNKCTYIPTADVLPLHSLLYEEYMLFDELNRVKINGQLIDTSLKQRMMAEVFSKRKKVTVKALADWLQSEGLYKDKTIEITGTHKENEFDTSLRTVYDLTNHGFTINESTLPMLEELVRWSTVFENRAILKQKVEQEYGDVLTPEQKNFICRKRYTGWGRLSRELLDGIQGTLNSEPVTVIEIMRSQKGMNLMRVLHHKPYGFEKAIDDYNNDMPIEQNELEKLVPSPSLRRGVRQAMHIVDELAHYQEHAPKYIFIENTREDDPKKKGKRTVNRLLQIKNYYQQLVNDKDSKAAVSQECSEQLSACEKSGEPLDDRKFLYFIQLGKCLYSGKSLDFDNLSTTCQIDHILPQCYIKDDSIDNRALVLSSENQRKQDNLLLDSSIIERQRDWWRYLNRIHLLSDKKLYNLTREAVEPQEMLGFINRQLVETSQIIKHVITLFHKRYPDTQVIGINARLSSALRERYELLKVREINDSHHAYDAFLACTMGLFTSTYMSWLSDDSVAKSRVRSLWLKNSKRDKYGIVLGAFERDQVDEETGEVLRDADKHIVYLKKVWQYRDHFFVHRKYEQTGKFYKETRYPADSPNAQQPFGKKFDIHKYGGFTSVNPAYIAAISYKKGKQREGALVNIPIYLTKPIENDPNALINFLSEQYEQVQVIHPHIMLNQKIEYEGNELLLRSCSEAYNACELYLPAEHVSVIYQLLHSRRGEYGDVTGEQLEHLLCLLLEKIDKLCPINSGVANRVRQKMDRITALSLQEKAVMVIETLKVTMPNGQFAQFKERLPALGFGPAQGRLNNRTFKPEKIILIDQSVTGFYERRTKLWQDSEQS